MKKLLVIVLALCLQYNTWALDVVFDNYTVKGNEGAIIKGVVFENPSDWFNSAEYKEINKEVAEVVKILADSAKQAPDAKIKVAGEIVASLVEPLKKSFDQIGKAVNEKHIINIHPGKTTDSWDWEEIVSWIGWGKDTAGKYFIVLFEVGKDGRALVDLEAPDSLYPNAFSVDVRGKALLRRDPATKKIAYQLLDYDEDVPDTNLRVSYQSDDWNNMPLSTKPKN